MLIQPIDYFLVVWFAIAAASTLYVGLDQYRNNPEPVVMKWGFILVTLCMGPLGMLLYVLADKEPRPGEHESFTKPLWKQGVGSTIHCVARDATGIILAAVITALLGLPMWLDLIVEYLAGFAFGLLIFQSLFMKSMMGGTYWENVRKSFMPEFISMNFMMAGMAPVMSFLMMGRDMRAMEPTELLFWGVMSLGVIAGFALAYPANVWLVARGLKHGLMTERREEAVHPDRSAQHAHSTPPAEPEKHGAEHSEKTEKTAPARVAVQAHQDHQHHPEDAAGNPSHHEPAFPVIAAIGKHPIHPMLVPLPIGLLFGGLLTDLAFWLTGTPAWATASLWLIGAGLVGGLAAAAAGLTDFFGSPQIRALYHARYHLAGNLIILFVAAISVALRLVLGPVETVLPWGLLMSAGSVALLGYTCWHGGEMVFGHGVGMQRHEHSSVHAGAGRSARQARHSSHARHGSAEMPGGHGMASDATVPQIAALSAVSFLALTIGMAAPANWVNMALSARDVGGAIMPPGMIMDRDTSADAMRDMAAADPRLVTASYDLAATGDQDLPFRMENGVRVFELRPSVIRWQILPDVSVDAYAYNGQIPGPRIRIRQGDRLRVNVFNDLPEETTIHWHGMILPNEMDGPAEITQAPIEPGHSYSYEFTAIQHGTYFYHPHAKPDRTQALGLYGALIIDPANPADEVSADHEYVVQLQGAHKATHD